MNKKGCFSFLTGSGVYSTDFFCSLGIYHRCGNNNAYQSERITKEERILKNKERLVEEKIKRGEKLITEDLLAIQGTDVKK